MQWFYADDSDRQHEVSEEDLPALVEAGTIRKDTLVWNETLDDWKSASEARPDLFGGAPLPPALTPAQRKQVTALPPTHENYTPPTDAVAVCSLVFGVLGLLCIPLFGIVGVICGHIALRRTKDVPNPGANKGLAIAGLASGYLGIVVLAIIVIFYGAVIIAAIASGELDA